MTNWQYPANWQPPPKRRWRRALGNNALVAGIVSAIVAGVITLLITHYQDQASADQARSDEQTAAVLQLETAATNFDQATISLYAGCSPHPEICTSTPRSYIVTETIFNADRANVTDPAADNLAAQLENDANDAITMEAVTGSDVNVNEMVAAYQQLIMRCGQLVQGQA